MLQEVVRPDRLNDRVKEAPLAFSRTHVHPERAVQGPPGRRQSVSRGEGPRWKLTALHLDRGLPASQAVRK